MLNKKIEEILIKWERKIPKRILWGKKIDEELDIRRTDEKVYSVYGKPKINDNNIKDTVAKAHRKDSREENSYENCMENGIIKRKEVN